MDTNKELSELEKLHKNLLRVKDSSNARDVVAYLKDCVKSTKNPAQYSKILNGVVRSVRKDYSVGLLSDDECNLIYNYINNAMKRCK